MGESVSSKKLSQAVKKTKNFTNLIMFSFIFKRILMVIPTFIAITLITFALVHLIPGDPNDGAIRARSTITNPIFQLY